jgi:hypothetical protein
VLQLELLKLLPNEVELPPESLDAKVEIFLVTFSLWQAGQVTSPTLLLLSTSSSNGWLHSAHINSKMGIVYSRYKDDQYRLKPEFRCC